MDKSIAQTDSLDCGQAMYQLATTLFPICRSITGEGVRETLAIIQQYVPVQVHEVPTGTRVFDWLVPNEWNVRDAYVLDERGYKVIDFHENNLHVLGYSIPVDMTVSLSELQKHLYSLEDMPDAIPYVTSYYEEQWGFSSARNGWSFRLRRKDRVILYLIPQDGAFLVGVVLGERAAEAAHDCGLPAAVVALVDGAPRYAEGRGIRFAVTGQEDCVAAEALVALKMAP